MQRWVFGIAMLAACAAEPKVVRAPVPVADVRIAATITLWGQALARGEDATTTEDVGGQVALVYGVVKAAASHADGGGRAVEETLEINVIAAVFAWMWPGLFGELTNGVYVVVPGGTLASSLVTAGLAQARPDTPGAIAVLPADATLGRVQAAVAAHRAELRGQEAWTCRPTTIAATVPRDEPHLAYLASVSTNIVTGWLSDVDAIWIVRAACAQGPGVFVVTGHVDATTGVTSDRVLVAKVMGPAGADHSPSK